MAETYNDLRARIAEVIVGSLLGQAEARGDYASYDFDPNDPAWNLVHLDTSIDPVTVADAVIRELDMVQENEMVKDGPLMSDGFQKMKLRHRYVTEWETE